MVTGTKRVVNYQFKRSNEIEVVSPLTALLHVIEEIIKWFQLPHIASAFASAVAFLRNLFSN